jgi:hypothetical protein
VRGHANGTVALRSFDPFTSLIRGLAAGSVLDATTVGDRLYAIIRIDGTGGFWTTGLAAT